MAGVPMTLLTEGRQLKIERLAETKSEFRNGQMFAMAGVSQHHSLLDAGPSVPSCASAVNP